ncbi:hypothetical protein ABZ791_30660 [Streptomyces huasconensis]|uniref:TetR family transcriptional regulator n=1 Tax=Streptomyces huasconensis TaxID=1854574 RepID=A0ABV3M1V7_9ACTN
MTHADAALRIRTASAGGNGRRIARAQEVIDAPGFAAVEESVAACLEAEVRHGRLAAATDTVAAALALAGTVHPLLMTGRGGSRAPRQNVERLAALVVGSGTATEPLRQA